MLIAKLSLALLIASHRAFNLLWNRDFESFLVKFKDFDVRKAIPTRQLVNSVDYLYRSKSGQARFRPVRQSPETPDWAENTVPALFPAETRPWRLRSRATRHNQRCLSLRVCKGVDHRDRAGGCHVHIDRDQASTPLGELPFLGDDRVCRSKYCRRNGPGRPGTWTNIQPTLLVRSWRTSRGSDLILTAKMNGVAPHDGLADVLARLHDHPAKRIDELLPWNWQRERQQKAAAQPWPDRRPSNPIFSAAFTGCPCPCGGDS